MITEIKSVEITASQIILEGTNLETIFTAEDLYEELEEETMRFVFDRHENAGANLKYLWKVCASQKKMPVRKKHGRKAREVGRLHHLSFQEIHRTLTYMSTGKPPKWGLFFCAGLTSD